MARSLSIPSSFRPTRVLLPFAWFPLFALVACSSGGSDSAPTGDSGAVDSGTEVTDGSSSADADGGAKGDGAQVSCTAAIATALQPIASVSTGVVNVTSDTGGVKVVYIDAAAGGINKAATTPRLYLNLETLARVDITDVAAPTSATWDLALKRNVIFTNSGSAGPGTGGAAYLAQRSFDSVTTADVATADFRAEEFVDADCNAYQDRIGGPLTSFGDWYEYDEATNALAPKNGTFVVRGAAGKAYKLRILNYYSTPDGGTGMAGGFFTLQVAAL